MKKCSAFVLALVLASIGVTGSFASQAGQVTTSEMEEVVQKILTREQNEVVAIGLYNPIMETYIQEVKPQKEMGEVPQSDGYILAQADFKNGVALHSMLPRKFELTRRTDEGDFDSKGFLQMAFVDRAAFDLKHYTFQYAGRDFLGAIRCYMFDVTPRPKSGAGRFEGRIWVEDKNFTIVRFNGVFVNAGSFWGGIGADAVNDYTHFDTWRCNLRPETWLPCYIFSEKTNPKKKGDHPLYKSQTRFWGYGLSIAKHQEEFSEMTIDDPNSVEDESAAEDDDSPLQAVRDWRSQAQRNVVDALERSGSIAPEGPVDKILDTVVNNILVTNNLDIDPPVECRVLLTSTLEMFSIGHTIVISRGLIDVLPDEATLAVMLAQGISDAMVPKPFTDDYAFSDTTRVSTRDAMRVFTFRDTKMETSSANEKAMKLLRNSPYAGNLSKAGLFLEQLHSESNSLKALINPRLGNGVYLASQIANSAPTLQPKDLDQIAALPMGSRIKLNPWNDKIEMLKAKPVPLLSEREKMPFEITPFRPYLTRYRQDLDLQGQNLVGKEIRATQGQSPK